MQTALHGEKTVWLAPRDGYCCPILAGFDVAPPPPPPNHSWVAAQQGTRTIHWYLPRVGENPMNGELEEVPSQRSYTKPILYYLMNINL